MIRVVVGKGRVRRDDETSLVVRVGAISSEAARERLEAAVTVSIADPALARAMTSAIAEALRAAGRSGAAAGVTPRVVHLRTRKRLAVLVAERPEELTGAVAVVRVTERNARHLLALIDGIRAAGARAVQMQWNGLDPARSRVERHVFAVLERARSTPNLPPVILARTPEPMEALLLIHPRDDRS